MFTRSLVPLAAVVTVAVALLWKKKKQPRSQGNPKPAKSVAELIGHTPVVRIASLSLLTGCEIWGKLEMANPGGSAKDRVALAVIEAAEREGRLRPGFPDCVFEGTSGSTGISIALLCQSRGYEAHIVLPDDTSPEKVGLLRQLGAHVHMVRPASIADSGHYVNVARNLAAEMNESGNRLAIFADQFETESNWRAHYFGTGPELWDQLNQLGLTIDAFVTGAGTGGTIAGVAHYLKERDPNVGIVLADPPGSGLYNKVQYGVMYDTRESEGKRRRHQVDTIVEGIGLNRLTRNVAAGLPLIDSAHRISDEETVAMAHHLVTQNGLFVGSSSAVNCVASYREALKLGPGHVITTILCDSGSRHMSKLYQAPYTADAWKECPSL